MSSPEGRNSVHCGCDVQVSVTCLLRAKHVDAAGPSKRQRPRCMLLSPYEKKIVAKQKENILKERKPVSDQGPGDRLKGAGREPEAAERQARAAPALSSVWGRFGVT